jgi:hypothetical protein
MRRARKYHGPNAARRGFTLLEALIVVSGVAMMLGLCAVSIQVLLKLNADLQGRYTAGVALDRLGRQVRHDVHSSSGALLKVDSKPVGLRLLFGPDQLAVYEPQDGAIVRSESRSERVVRHESFALPKGATAHFELRDQGTRRLVALVITHSAGKSRTEPPRPLEVLAVLGKYPAHPVASEGGTPR